MQALNEVQADAILDVVDACGHVSIAWEACQVFGSDRKAAPESPAGKALAEASAAYAKAVDRLTVAYRTADAHAVEDDLLMQLIARNVPDGCTPIVSLSAA